MAAVTWILPIYVVILIMIIAFAAGSLYQDTSNTLKFIESNSISDYCNNRRLNNNGAFKWNTGSIFIVSLLIVVVVWICLISTLMVLVNGANATSMESHLTIADSDTLSAYPDHRSFASPKPMNTNHSINADKSGRGDYDYPWGHIYKARVWCSVLTMWPERRQNIEV